MAIAECPTTLYKPLDKSTALDLAKRYMWFIGKGVKHPTLNDPDVIYMEATPEHVDRLIQEGMERWPAGSLIDPLSGIKRKGRQPDMDNSPPEVA